MARKATKETRMDRAKRERMYYMGRAAASSESAAAFIVTGQSGKVWTVSLPKKGSSAAASSSRMSRFRCNCPDNIMRKGTCKHMLFVCLRVLKISEEHLDALEGGGELDLGVLHEALENVAPAVDDRYCAPAALKERLKAIAGDFENSGSVPKVEPRMPEEDEPCPICYENLLDGTPLVHCGYGCGKPVHVECFERYTKAQNQRFNRNEIGDTKLRCVTCRMDWVIEPTGTIGKRGMLVGRRAIDLAQSMPEQFVGTTTRPASSSRSASTSSSKTSKKGRPTKRKAGAKVKGGRVTKAKTEGARKSSRIAGRKEEDVPGEEEVVVENAAPISKRKSTRKSAGKATTKKEPASPAKRVVTKRRSTRASSSASAKRTKSGWANAVAMRGADEIERESAARSTRAARRSAGSTRRTRSQVA